MANETGQQTAEKAARLGISLDWLAVIAAIVLVILVKLDWLPKVTW
jgi:hypothetical protein